MIKKNRKFIFADISRGKENAIVEEDDIDRQEIGFDDKVSDESFYQ